MSPPGRVLKAAERFSTMDSIWLCGTEYPPDTLRTFAVENPRCYIWGYNNGLMGEFNPGRKCRFPWKYERPDDEIFRAF